jgi:hypothetical protein
MVKKIVYTAKRRGRIIVRYKDRASGGQSGAACAGVRVRIEDLPAYLARWGLKVVGGDLDLEGQPWRPKVYVVEM